MTNSILAIIPARGGSKGIPRKNLVELNGEPLIWWSIRAAQESRYVTSVVVSSDDDEILDYSVVKGCIAVRRPSKLSEDQSLTAPVISHVLKEIGTDICDFTYLALLQPTSPFRTAEHIDSAFKNLIASGADGIIGVREENRRALKWFVEEGGYLKGAVNEEFPFMRRQDLPVAYSANGAIYISKISSFSHNNSLLSEKTLPFCMDTITSIDIDTLDDLESARSNINKLPT